MWFSHAWNNHLEIALWRFRASVQRHIGGKSLAIVVCRILLLQQIVWRVFTSMSDFSWRIQSIIVCLVYRGWVELVKKKLTIPRPHQHEEHKLEETTARNQTLQDFRWCVVDDDDDGDDDDDDALHCRPIDAHALQTTRRSHVWDVCACIVINQVFQIYIYIYTYAIPHALSYCIH